MKTEIKEVYKCEFCNKLYQIKKYAILHEHNCVKNPKNKRPCFDCSKLCKKVTTVYYDTIIGEGERVLNLLYCKEFDTFLQTPQVINKGNAFETYPESNIPMPKKCDYKCDYDTPF